MKTPESYHAKWRGYASIHIQTGGTQSALKWAVDSCAMMDHEIAELKQQLAHARRSVNLLIKIATGETSHLYMGECLDKVDGHERRDKQCKACRLIIQAEKLTKKTK